MKRKALAICVVAMTLVPPSALGWGSDGHKIIGEIAWANLDEAAKKEVMRLLKQDSKYGYLNEACVWADDIKDDDSWNWARSLHYVNIPEGKDYDARRDCRDKDDCPDGTPCPDRDCVVAAIQYYVGVLKDKDASDEDRLIALKFIAHFVGDLHQPLHAGYSRDKGGNDRQVEFFNNRTNLHALWDSGLIRRHLNQTRRRWMEYARDLSGPDAITAKQRQAWGENIDPVAWTNESHALVPKVYQGLGQGSIGQPYFVKSMPMLEEQLKKGGVRLAALLNEALGSD